MKAPLFFNFEVDKEQNKIYVQRSFAAPASLVWKAWTTAELLDQWWAPLPYKNQTKSLVFKNGGHWHYAMVSPENEVHWCRFDYETIAAEQQFTGYDAFCDEEGHINTQFDRMHWNYEFKPNQQGTMVSIIISVGSLDTLEKIIAMGFKEGFTMGLNQLDALMSQMNKTVQVHATIQADKQKVWAAYTEPEHIVQWNFADPSWHCPSAQNDMQIGGKYSARMEAKDGSMGFDLEAEYTNIDPYNSFAYTLSDGRKVVVSIQEPQADTTLLEISFDPENENPIALQQAGWQAILNNFKTYAESY